MNDDILNFDYILKNLRKEVPIIIKEVLINDSDFLDEVNTILRHYNPSLLNKSIEYKMDFFNSHIGNGSRGYILTIIVIKHLYKKLLNNSNYYLDKYWLKIVNDKF